MLLDWVFRIFLEDQHKVHTVPIAAQCMHTYSDHSRMGHEHAGWYSRWRSGGELCDHRDTGCNQSTGYSGGWSEEPRDCPRCR